VALLGTDRGSRASKPLMLAMSIPGLVLLVLVGVLAIGCIAWLLPRPDSSLVIRSGSPEESTDHRSGG
jgi:hypothetical protein